MMTLINLVAATVYAQLVVFAKRQLVGGRPLTYGPDPDGTSLTGYLHRYVGEVPTHEVPGWVLDLTRAG